MANDDFAEKFPELADARVRVWFCPVDEHGKRSAVTVEWIGDTARCTAPGCTITSDSCKEMAVELEKAEQRAGSMTTVRSWRFMAMARAALAATAPNQTAAEPREVCCLRPQGHGGRHTNKVGWSEPSSDGEMNESSVQPMADSELRDRIAMALFDHDQNEGDNPFAGGLTDASVKVVERYWARADAVLAAVVAPVLAERDAEIAELKARHLERDEINAGWVKYKQQKIQERRDHQKALADALGIEPDSRGMYPPIPELVARIAANTQYTETTRYHQQKHAEAVRELNLAVATRQQYAEERDAAITKEKTAARIIDGLRGERITLWEERDKAATALAAIKDWKWEYPPSLLDRIELVASELDNARRQLEQLKQERTRFLERTCEKCGRLNGDHWFKGGQIQRCPDPLDEVDAAEGPVSSGVVSQPDSEPRVWRDAEGDPEPVEENLQLRDRDGGECWFRGRNYWHGPYGYSLAWSDLIDQHGPLTEVVVDQPGGGQ